MVRQDYELSHCYTKHLVELIRPTSTARRVGANRDLQCLKMILFCFRNRHRDPTLDLIQHLKVLLGCAALHIFKVLRQFRAGGITRSLHSSYTVIYRFCPRQDHCKQACRPSFLSRWNFSLFGSIARDTCGFFVLYHPTFQPSDSCHQLLDLMGQFFLHG